MAKAKDKTDAPEAGTLAEAQAAAQVAGVSLSPEVTVVAPGPVDFRRRVRKTITFTLYGQMVTWREGDVVDFAGYGGQPVVDRCVECGVDLDPVSEKA